MTAGEGLAGQRNWGQCCWSPRGKWVVMARLALTGELRRGAVGHGVKVCCWMSMWKRHERGAIQLAQPLSIDLGFRSQLVA
jgi:hypothetical protein